MRKVKDKEYFLFVDDVAKLIESGRRAAARSVNNVMTATYWLVGRRIIEQEQRGKDRAQYGKGLLMRLSADLSSRCGKGYSPDNLETMRMFYRAFALRRISEKMSRKSRTGPREIKRNNSETLSRNFDPKFGSAALPLSWSHYVSLVRRTRSPEALGRSEER